MTITKSTAAKFLAGSFLGAATAMGGIYLYEQAAFDAPDLNVSALPYSAAARPVRAGKMDGCLVYNARDNQALFAAAATTFLASPRADYCEDLQKKLIKRHSDQFPKPLPRGLFGPWPGF